MGGMELVNVISVQPVGGYTLRLGFSDGTIGDVDLSDELWGEMFEPLRDSKVFAQVRVDDEIGTIVWPNGADLDPESLYATARRIEAAG